MRSPRIAPPENGEVGSTRDHADALARRAVVRDQRIDDGRLAGAGIAGDADDVALPGVREQRLERFDRVGPAIVDVAHQPRGGANVALRDRLDVDGHGASLLNRCSGPAGV